LSDIYTRYAICEHVHEKLPLPKHVHGDVYCEDEAEVEYSVHEFGEGEATEEAVEWLGELFAAELEATANAWYYCLVQHVL